MTLIYFYLFPICLQCLHTNRRYDCNGSKTAQQVKRLQKRTGSRLKGNVSVNLPRQKAEFRQYFDAVFPMYEQTEDMSQPVSLSGPTSVLGRLLFPQPPTAFSCFSFLHWGTERDIPVNLPPFMGSFVRVKCASLLSQARNVEGLG